MSFMLTIHGFRSRRKTVTRRLGWWELKPGDRVMGCEKCQGRRAGEPLVRMGEIEIVSAVTERLDALSTRPIAEALEELRKEDFPNLTVPEFIDMFCGSHTGCRPHTEINRIEFRYV